jgi:hypothetical protein
MAAALLIEISLASSAHRSLVCSETSHRRAPLGGLRRIAYTLVYAAAGEAPISGPEQRASQDNARMPDAWVSIMRRARLALGCAARASARPRSPRPSRRGPDDAAPPPGGRQCRSRAIVVHVAIGRNVPKRQPPSSATAKRHTSRTSATPRIGGGAAARMPAGAQRSLGPGGRLLTPKHVCKQQQRDRADPAIQPPGEPHLHAALASCTIEASVTGGLQTP